MLTTFATRLDQRHNNNMATPDVMSAVDKAMQGAMKAKPSGATGGAKAVNLDKAALDLNQLRNDNRMELIDLLDNLEGKKCLVLDSALGGRLNHVVVEGARLLRDHGVAHFRELKGEDVGDFEENDEPDFIVYIVRAIPELMTDIAKQVRTMVRKGLVPEISPGADPPVVQKKKVHVAMLPRKTLLCQQLLEDEKVLPYVEVSDLHVDFIAFEKDLLSLEMDECFKEVKVYGDPTTLDFAATAMLKLENTFGRATTIRTIGPAGRAIAERMSRYRRKSEILKLRKRGTFAPVTQRIFGSALPPPMPEDDWPEHSDIDTLLVIDREVDLVTPFITPLTYEGLIDELFPGGIKNAAVKVPPSVLDGEAEKKNDTPSEPNNEDDDDESVTSGGSSKLLGKKGSTTKKEKATVSFALNSNDPLFGEVRDLNVERLGSYLGEKAKQIRGSYDQFRSNKNASIHDIHDFVKQIPGLTQKYKSLQTHINLVERVKKTTDGKNFREKWHTERQMLEGDLIWENLEERINMQEPPMQVLRMLCLQAQTQGGIRGQAKYDLVRREVIQTYGFELLGTLHNLELSNLFFKKKDATLTVQNVSTAGYNALSNVMASSGLAADNSPFSNLRRQLRLIVDDVDPHKPQDAAYVSSGYVPLSVRLVEYTAPSNNWASIGPALVNLAGPAMQYDQTVYSLEELDKLMRAHSPRLHYDMENCRPPLTASFLVGGTLPPPDTPDDDYLPASADDKKDDLSSKKTTQQQQQQVFDTERQNATSAGMTPVPVKMYDLPPPPGKPLGHNLPKPPPPPPPARDPDYKPVMVVYYIGGITYAEIAALRFIASRPNFPYSLVIATTSIINGTTFLKSLVYDLKNNLKRPEVPAAEEKSKA